MSETAHICCVSMIPNLRVGNFSNTPSTISEAACAIATDWRARRVSM